MSTENVQQQIVETPKYNLDGIVGLVYEVKPVSYSLNVSIGVSVLMTYVWWFRSLGILETYFYMLWGLAPAEMI